MPGKLMLGDANIKSFCPRFPICPRDKSLRIYEASQCNNNKNTKVQYVVKNIIGSNTDISYIFGDGRS